MGLIATICYRLFMLTFNLAFISGSIAIILLGAAVSDYSKKHDEAMQNFTLHRSKTAAVICLVLGASMLAFGILGCLAALLPSFLLLNLYIMAVVAIAMLQAGMIMSFRIYGDRLSMFVEAGLFRSLRYYNDSKDVKEAWDKMQCTFSCCGVDNACDWQLARNITSYSSFVVSFWVPSSCCGTDMALVNNCTLFSIPDTLAVGCYKKFKGFFRSRLNTMYVCIFIAFAVEGLSALFAYLLVREITKPKIEDELMGSSKDKTSPVGSPSIRRTRRAAYRSPIGPAKQW